MQDSASSETLDDAPFSYRLHKDDRVSIAWRGKVVTTLAGNAARRFLARALHATPEEEQLLMAKATGNFKRGNERDAHRP